MPSETQMMNLPEGSPQCNISQVEFIECRIVNSKISHKESGLNVSCNLEEGLVCYGDECPDFEIRLLCQCGLPTTTPSTSTTQGKVCDVTKPNMPHEKNCHLFYQCVDTLVGPTYKEKSCGPHMMYNRETLVCDHAHYVVENWPQCLGTTETPPAATTIPTTKGTQVTTFRPPVTTTSAPLTTSRKSVDITPRDCAPGEVWKSCGVPCDKVCLYYEFLLISRGFCNSSEDCIQGCFTEELRGGCPPGFVWRDQKTCVSVADCTCYSNTGEPVKPGEVKYESDCKTCQCINNQYLCDTSRCVSTEVITEGTVPTKPTPKSHNRTVEITTLPTIIIPSTSTPPLPCSEQRFIPLVQGDSPLPDNAFSASSSDSGAGHQPYFARIQKKSKNENAWISGVNDKNQFLQINIGRIEPVFGVSLQGAPSGLVTSYKVLYSADGNFYHYVSDVDGSPVVFRGPLDQNKPFEQKFPVPIEAQYIRLNPLTWKGDISMRVELYGCGELPSTTVPPYSSTPITTITSAPLECSEEMGLDNGMMSDQQIKVSSIRDNNPKKYGPSQLRLSNGGGAWMPASNDKDQWIQFDFLEPRNITGFITSGSIDAGAWVEAFKVLYSQEGLIFNQFLDDTKQEKVFPGNFDSSTTHKNSLGHILRTRFLHLIPLKWHKSIAVRAEIIGCYEPYPNVTTVPSSTTTPVTECQVCTGVPPEQMLGDECLSCDSNLFWDGKTCVNKTNCPCFVDHIRYEIGKAYETEDCQECICKLNGIPECKKKLCSNTCKLGQQRVLTPSCGCTCKECPEGTVLCPTSSVCINKTFWCNGVEDCPDDERDCPETPRIYTTTPCPPISCPPGTKPIKVPSPGQSKRIFTSFTKKGVKGGKRPFDFKIKNPNSGAECEPVECVPILPPTTKPPEECSKPMCAPSYILVRVPSKIPERCPRYKCIRRHSMCNVTHNTVDTFDGIEFKHDICNHILARDSDEMRWEVSLVKNCSSLGTCYRYLSIIQGKYTINMFPDMSVDLDGVLYSAHETKHLGGKYKPYAIFHIGDSLLFQSNHYGFWVVWDTNANAKIGVTGKLHEGVEGLCGTFNGNPDDDRTTPEGRIAKSNIEFGKSWAIPGSPECEVKLCPIELQKQAKEICNAVRTSSLNQCKSVVDLDRFVARCMESTCACLTATNASTSKDARSCRCTALLGLVADCQSADSSIDLSGWRTHHGCPATCPPSFVYHDCYRHKCEPSCGSSHDVDSCDTLPGTCFSGCFCPDGLLRLNDRCISPDECRDCVCDGFGDPQYMTFDRSNFTFNGNCTYVASQDFDDLGNHTYQVLVTNNKCHDEPASTCTEAVEVKYLNHSVLVKRGTKKNEVVEIIAVVDGKSVTRYPYKESSWLRLEKVENSVVTILVVPIQLEVTYVIHNYAFTVRLPSNIFQNKTEGLCGNCNKNKGDDFRTLKGVVTNDTNAFGLSWLHPRPLEEKCQVTTKDVGCNLLPPDEDPCLHLINSPVFQKCRNILDPAPYVVACKYDLCHSLNRTDAACRDMEAYVSDCERSGICLDWRSADLCPFKCPSGKQHLACQAGCAGTCDNINHSASNCSSVISDGCYCPKGQVLIGDICVSETRCHPCDDKGHFSGDKWQQDKCTNCTCEGSTTQCEQQVCPNIETICKEGMIPVEEEPSEKECCRKVTCVPSPPPTVTTCPPPKIPKCREDQNATSITDSEGCQIIVCKCKPCEPIHRKIVSEGYLKEEEVEKIEVGMRLELENSGCCPKMAKVCHPEDCPKPSKCLTPYIQQKKAITVKKCCPEYECVPPPLSCLIEDKSTGEIIVRKVGSEWRESPCRSCVCREISGTYESSCDNVICPSSDINFNITKNYVIDSKPPAGECCPVIKRTACKVNDTVLESGKSVVEYFPDQCIRYVCELTGSGSVEKKSEIERCSTKCQTGWKYNQSEDKSKRCCGECKPMGCVQDGVFYPQGKSWKSSDYCTEYICLLKNDTVQIEAKSISCSVLPEGIRDEYFIKEQTVLGECCNVPKFVSCKYNGELYEVGETWISTENPCQNFSCERLPDGQLTKKETVETCSTCNEGWEYVPPPVESRVCCGHCRQVACVWNGTIYAPNASWKSLDQCTNYTCELATTGEYQVISMKDRCPSIEQCPKENIYQDGCCKRCKMPPSLPSLKECGLKNMSSRGEKVFIKEVHGSHGLCTNKLTNGFTECEGACFSYTKYNQESDKHDEFCNCCQAEGLSPVKVPMLCEDGFTYHKIIQMPSSCLCKECSEATIETKKEVKTGTKPSTKVFTKG